MARREALAGAALLLATLGAGCLGSGAGGEDPGDATVPPADGGPGTDPARAPSSGAPAALAVLAYRDCHEFHAFYAVDWADWAPMMPDGFGPDGTDPTGTLTTLYQHVSMCQVARPGRAAPTEAAVSWTGLRVTPPEALALRDAVVHAVPIGFVVSDAALAATYRGWGFGDLVREGTITVASTRVPGAADVGRVETRSGGASHALTYEMGPPAEGSVAGAGRVFAVAGREVVGWFDYAWPSWTDRGYGSVEFTQQGDPSAPPAYAGSIHQVEDVDLTVTYAAAPAAAGGGRHRP